MPELVLQLCLPTGLIPGASGPRDMGYAEGCKLPAM